MVGWTLLVLWVFFFIFSMCGGRDLYPAVAMLLRERYVCMYICIYV